MDQNTLEARVARIEDREAIRTLRHTYHNILNERQLERWGEIYTPDALVVIDYAATWKGVAEIEAGFKIAARRLTFLKQYLHNHEITLNGDTATAYAYFEARYVDDGESVMVAGKYDEKYLRTSAGWRITETKVTLDFSVPLSKGWAGETRNTLKPFEKV